MPSIELITHVRSSAAICFDLSRSVDLHLISTARTQEKAVEGVTSGLMNLGDWVTWEARHLGIRQRLTSRITVFDRPHHFRDEQVKGAFASFQHDHYFESSPGGVLMREVFAWRSPLGLLGRAADVLFLRKYMLRFLSARNEVIREYAESGKWKMILPEACR